MRDHLSEATDPSGQTNWTYNAFGEVESKQQMLGGTTATVTYDYGSSGQLDALTLPSGNVVSYSYTDGKITGVSVGGNAVLSDVLYEPFGSTSGWAWGNTTLAVRIYDSSGRIEQIDSQGLITYEYDPGSRITEITDVADSTRSWSYGYDALDRLTSANRTGLSQSWTHDANGNRLAQGGTSSSTYTNVTASNRLNGVAGAVSRTYSYDAAGNTTGYGGLTFTYNDASRMTAVSGGASAAYAYNGMGQRVKKTTGGITTHFAYDEAGHLVGEYSNSGSPIQETVWLGDIPVAVLKPNGSGGVNVFYIHTDHLNTPRRISRPSDNAVVWRWDGDPFGAGAASEDPDGDTQLFTFNLRFPGQYYDQETGLHQNYFRDYDPATGRFPQSDPIGLRGGLNTYGYVKGNPVSLFDPDGLRARVCCRLIPYVGVVGARHCYVERDTNGNRTTWGLIGDRGGPLSRFGDIYIDNAFDDGGSCGPWTDECDTDECVERAANRYPNPSNYRFARGPNSNTFAGTVARKCNLARPPVLLTPGWGDSPATQRPGVPHRPPTDLSP